MNKFRQWIERRKRWLYPSFIILVSAGFWYDIYTFLGTDWYDLSQGGSLFISKAYTAVGIFLIISTGAVCLESFRSAMRVTKASVLDLFWFLLGGLGLLTLILLGYAHIYLANGLNGTADDEKKSTTTTKISADTKSASETRIVHDPHTALYFSVMTFTTVGYGDITPTHRARLAASAEAICGFIYIGVFIATLTSLIAATNRSSE